VDLLRPGRDAHSEETARDVVRGEFTFLRERRDLGANPFPAPADAPLLWAYHLEYMDYLLDLGRAGETDRIDELCRARLDTEARPRLSATHPYPESRRTASWIRALATAAERTRPILHEGTWIWANRIAVNLELDVGGNHLLENGLALALAAVTFTGPRAAGFRQVARRILTDGARDQVLADGGHYELSPSYHARVLGVLLEGGRALEASGDPMPGGYWDTLSAMATFLAGIVDPEGELPLLGDCSREAGFRPARFLEAVGAHLPGPIDPPPVGDRAYPESGLHVLEDPAEGHRLVLDAGRVCPEHLPAHGQADTFTYEMHVAGKPFVVDAGLFEYAAGRMRDWCRATRAHSTVEVDGWNSSEVWASFRVGRRANVSGSAWFVSDGRGEYRGAHDGYRHLGVNHVRLVSHLDRGLFLVADRLSGRGEHQFTSRIHLHPDVVVAKADAGGFVFHRAGERLLLLPFGAEKVTVEDGWHCPEFGRRRKSRLLCLHAIGADRSFGYVLKAGGEGPIGISRDDASLRIEVGGRRYVRRAP
jgi:hypothetical protein